MNVTVVISNYNYAQFVNSAIESCLAQTIPCDIIVVDDASTDHSWDVIKQYNVKAVRLKDNSGGNARGKNVGICLSQTPYVTCLDADDMLLPNSLKVRVPHLKDHDFVHGWSYMVRSIKSYKRLIRQPLPKFVMGARAKKLMKQGEPRWAFAIEASTVLAAKSLYQRFGLYDEEMKWTIDREMWYRWLFHGATKKVVNQYVSLYRRHANQLTQDHTKKDPKKCSSMLSQRIKMRQTITAENTLMMDRYDYQSFVQDAY